MKCLKVSLKYVVSANNAIEEHVVLDNNLHQTASNYWILTSDIEDKIKYYFDLYKIKFIIEEVETY